MLARLPCAIAKELDAGAVHQQVQRPVSAAILTPLFAGHQIRLRCPIDQASDLRDLVAADAVGQETRVVDAVKAGGEDMDQEPANELIRGQPHDLHPVAAADVGQ